jgi:methyl-accepting chemotaxis protein
MSDSIGEINSRVNQTKNIADGAKATAVATGDNVATLASGAEQIGDVLGIIQQIAYRTNLLALNAAIEAARAGEMGKGFGVVASEVKNLASQTAKATEDISRRVASISGSTRNAVAAIWGISKTIEDVAGCTAAIAASIERQ